MNGIMKIKRSPVVILKNLIFLEALGAIAFFIAKMLADYGEIYERVGFLNVVSYNIAQTVFLFAGQACIIAYVFFRWYREYIFVDAEKVFYSRGLLFRRERAIMRPAITAVNFNQSSLDKLVGSGTVTIRSDSENVLIIPNIGEPEEFTDILMRRKTHSQRSLGTQTLAPEAPLAELIMRAETEDLEFKATFRWDIRGSRVNKMVEKAVMKTMAAFMNSGGGTLVIGVDDTRAVVGLDYDYASLGKPNSDGFENHFSHVFQNMIGAQFRHLARLAYETHDGKACCIVRVMPSNAPVYLMMDDTEEFYIRTGNGTTALKFSEAAAYISSRFT